MTEAEWFACRNPNQMLAYVKSKASDRKLRLFAASCCRSIWNLYFDLRSRQAIEVAERAADLLVDRGELEAAFEAAREVVIACQGFTNDRSISFKTRCIQELQFKNRAIRK